MGKNKEKPINLASIARNGKKTQKEWDEEHKDGKARQFRAAVFKNKKKDRNKYQSREKTEIDE